MQASSAISLSPSFNSYSNTKLTEIAARVVEEFGGCVDEFYDDFYFEREVNLATPDRAVNELSRVEEENNSDYVARERENSVIAEEDADDEDEEDDEEEEFEFAFLNRETEFSSPISADEIFHNGQIRPVYPVFNKDLFMKYQGENENEDQKMIRNSDSEKVPNIRLPLRKLFIEERETSMTMRTTSSSSSASDDELDGVPEDSYCVWRPKEAAAEGRCKKSSSTGSNSKRWKFQFKDLLNRSHSDGSKDNFAFLSPSNSGRKKQNREEIKGKETPVSGGKVKSAAVAAAPPPPPPPVYNRDGGEKRRSYLPYRQDLVGFLGNVNGLSKNLQPF